MTQYRQCPNHPGFSDTRESDNHAWRCGYGVYISGQRAAKELADRELEDLKTDNPVSPEHYSYPGGVQVIDLTRHMDFLLGNVVKYVARAGRKGNRLEDLQKAAQYLSWAIEDEESK